MPYAVILTSYKFSINLFGEFINMQHLHVLVIFIKFRITNTNQHKHTLILSTLDVVSCHYQLRYYVYF